MHANSTIKSHTQHHLQINQLSVMAILTKPKLLFLFFFILSLFLASQCDDDQNPGGQERRRELESCLRQCKSEGESPEQQLQCQRSCVMRYESTSQHQGEIKYSEESVIEDILNQHHHRDPEERLRECQQSCERQRGGQQRQLCKQRCEQEYRREQEHQHGRETGEDNQGRRDPEERLRECQQSCQRREQGQQQWQCQQRCQQEYQREKEQRPGQGETRDENQGRGRRDPEERLRECQQSCQRREQGPQQWQCQQRCQQEYQREKEQRHRGQEETRDENQGRNRPDPEERLRECQQTCQRQEQGPQQWQCQQRCQQEYQREKEQPRGQGETTDENQGRGRRDPEERLRECQQTCQRQEQGPQQWQCQQRCQQEYQREKEQHRGQGETGETTDENQGRGRRDPEERLRECQQTCQRQEHGPQQWQCQQRCQQEYQREKEQRPGQGETRDENQGRGRRDPEERLRECQQTCQRQQQGPQQRQCQQRCQQEYQREKEQRHRGQEIGEEKTNPEREREEENNPYLFKSQRFMSGYKSSHGDFRIVEKFTQRSELLRGLEKFRVGVVEFEPQSFMMPHHCDGEAIYFVGQGQGIASIANQDEKNSFNLEKGDVLKVCAGSTVYWTNRDNNEKFRVYVLAKSINTPGEVQEYFSGGGQNPESFYRAFSSDILETAFNTPRDRLERLFGQQKQGVIIKASEEQIRAISERASRSTEQTKGETRGPLNLLREQPLFGSRFGQFFEASPERFEQFRDLDVAVGFMNINQGGMVVPYYNTRSTRLVMVVEGNGRFEMACPHLGGQRHGQGSRRGQEEEQEQEGNVHYQKVRGTLNVGDLVVIPAGHPITFIATGNSNLRMVGFGVHAYNNKKNFLAGKQSIWRNVDREAKELSFNMPGREVEEIFQKQDQSFFVEGPEQHRQRGDGGTRGQEQHSTLSSILDFVF